MNEVRVAKIIRAREDAQRKVDEGTGALSQLKEELSKSFGCTVGEAKRKLRQIKKKRTELQKEFDEACEAFEERYENLLD